MQTPVLDFALNYISLGLAVLPLHTPLQVGAQPVCSCASGAACQSVGKHPRTLNGLKSASLDPKQINLWWQQWATANIGIATGAVSGIVVVDVDARHGGADSLKALEQQFGQLPLTVRAKTGNGWHLMFQHPGGRLQNSAGKLGQGLDIRGDGGYIVAPPSLHASGVYYEWDVFDIELAPLPDWMLGLLQPKTQQPATQQATQPPLVATAHNYQPIPDTFPQGQRNNELAKLAGKMRRHGFSQEAIRQALLSENNIRCQPPLPDAEVGRIAASVSRYTPDDPVLPVPDDALPIAPTPAWLWKDMKTMTFPLSIPVLHGINKGECAMLHAYPNAGKTTLMLNVALKMAVGDVFPPLLNTTQPQRTLYMIAESTPDLWQKDVNKMLESIPGNLHHLVDENFACMVAPQYDDEQIVINVKEHLKWVVEQIQLVTPDLVVIDTMSQFFILKDENSNAEMSSKVWRPLQKLARKNNCAIVIIHHYGKNKANDQMPELYAGRGASASGGAARTTVSLKQEKAIPELITVKCTKTKGEPFPDTVLRLDKETRWFSLSIIAPSRPKTNYDLVVEWVINQSRNVKLSEVLREFVNTIPERRVKEILADAVSCGDLEKTGRGIYCAPQPVLDTDDEEI